MATADRKYAKLQLTKFELDHDLILTAEEEKIAKKKRYARSWIRKLKVMTRPDETRPQNLPHRNPESNSKEIILKQKDQPDKKTGYMPSFKNRVANGSAEQKAEFAKLIGMPEERSREQGRDYRTRMSALRQTITPAPRNATPPSAAALRPVTRPGQTRPEPPPSDSFKAKPPASEFRNSSNPYAI